jgi:hypothetical protein
VLEPVAVLGPELALVPVREQAPVQEPERAQVVALLPGLLKLTWLVLLQDHRPYTSSRQERPKQPQQVLLEFLHCCS